MCEQRPDEIIYKKLHALANKADKRYRFTDDDLMIFNAKARELKSARDYLVNQSKQKLNEELPKHIDQDFLTTETLYELKQWQKDLTTGSHDFCAIKTKLAETELNLKKMSIGYYPEKIFIAEINYYESLVKYNRLLYQQYIIKLRESVSEYGFDENFTFSYDSIKLKNIQPTLMSIHTSNSELL